MCAGAPRRRSGGQTKLSGDLARPPPSSGPRPNKVLIHAFYLALYLTSHSGNPFFTYRVKMYQISDFELYFHKIRTWMLIYRIKFYIAISFVTINLEDSRSILKIYLHSRFVAVTHNWIQLSLLQFTVWFIQCLPSFFLEFLKCINLYCP